MPLPNYGHFNKEERKTQQLVFESPPQYVCVDHEEPCSGSYGHQKRAQVTKGTMDIEVERKLVFRPKDDKMSAWKAPKVDQAEAEAAKKYASKEHIRTKAEVKSTLDFSFHLKRPALYEDN